MTSNSVEINVPKFVTIKFRDKFKIRCMMKREPLLSHIMLKQGFTWFTLASNTRTVKRQYRYFSRMDFNLKAHCDFDYFHCAIPKDIVDVEMTIRTVGGIYTYRRDQTTQEEADKGIFFPEEENS